MIKTINYNDSSNGLKKDISMLIDKVWPDHKSNDIEIHPDYVNATSFYIYKNHQIISYVGIIQLEIQILNESYLIAGLSNVATHPEYQKLGYGSKIVREATEWINKNNKIDFGIFTCKPSLIKFYEKAGGWHVEPNVLLIGNEDSEAITSLNLNVAVLMRLNSKKAKLNQNIIKNTTINLNLPKNQFL